MESVLPCARIKRRRLVFRIRRVIVIVTMFVSSSLIFALYLITLTCSAGPVSLDQGAPGPPETSHQRVIVVQDGEEDERRYQQILDQVADNPTYTNLRRKPLLDDDPDPDTNRNINIQDTHHRTHGRRRHREEDNFEDPVVVRYNDDYLVEPDYTEYDESSSNKRTRKSKKDFNRDHDKASRKLPEAIIIGVKKGGTRALLEFLRIHPDVRAPGPEPHFFDRNYDKGIEWYRRQMPPTFDGQLTMEKTPSYFVTKGVPGRIYNMSKNIKFIIVVRDPVTRAISDYTQALAKRNDINSFEQMAFEDNSTGLVDTSWGAIRIGVYAKHLERWLQYFPLSQMHFVSGEKLIEDPAGEILKVQEFLGLNPLITEKNFSFNTTKGFPCLVRPNGNSRKPHCLGKTKGREHPKIDPKVLHRLRDFFRPFNQKFYQMVGQDFGWS